MVKEIIYIEKVGSYIFGDNYELIFRSGLHYLMYCNITCGNNCLIKCGYNCNIICGSRCNITCGWNCNISSQNNCIINSEGESYIKGGEGSKLKMNERLLKTISKGEEFIWWYINNYRNLINTYEDKDWRINNPEKFKELYPFVHNELDSATLF